MAIPFPRSEPISGGEPESPRAMRNRVNGALEHAWRKGWLQRPVLEPGALLDAASGTSGLSDFGEDNGWRVRLHLLCGALQDEADLTGLGTTVAFGQLVSALATRQRAVALWQRHPEIAELPITSPIIIVGQMRSGSTRMQRLLACDERLTFTRFYESWNPLPRWTHRVLDDRVLRGWFALKVAGFLNPRFSVIHPTGARCADEEIGFHNIALFGSALEAQWRIPSFARAGEQADAEPVYEEFRRFLQTVRWLRRERGDRPWVLKVPQFGQDLEAVLKVFPDARLIVLHRDPVSVVGSSASLVYNQMCVQSHAVDRAWIGREWLRKSLLRRDRTATARQRFDGIQADVRFDAMHADWRGEMRRVYAALGMNFTPAVEKAMTRFMNRRQHRRLGQHRYDITDFGLSRKEIEAAFAMRPGPASRLVGA
ncbi:sulfotransferase [Novosphingobium panipatense]|uniref:sulfotransferase family protein n=2 Tax=Novosphingobium TaxID=165696 RepID=UPI000CDA6142|nr:sulfotransferase [Novosphingobium sp. HII-3]